MYISSVSVDISHPLDVGDDIDDAAHQVRLPKNWKAYVKQVERSLQERGGLTIAIGSTAAPWSIAIAIGHPTSVESPSSALDERKVFGFVVGLSTLRSLRAAIDAAIAAVE